MCSSNSRKVRECKHSLGRGPWSRVVLAAARRGGHGISADNNGTGKPWEDPHLGLASVVAATPITVAVPAAASTPAASATNRHALLGGALGTALLGGALGPAFNVASLELFETLVK